MINTNYFNTIDTESTLNIIAHLPPKDRENLRKTCRFLKVLSTKTSLIFFNILSDASDSLTPRVLSLSSSNTLLFNSQTVRKILNNSSFQKLHLANVLESIETEEKEPFIEIAFKLMELGSQIPKPAKEGRHFNNRTEYFCYLLSDCRELFIALQNKSTLTLQDSQGKTLLHYAAELCTFFKKSEPCMKVLDILFRSEYLPFEVQDINGNTPLHLCALKGNIEVTHQSILPRFIKEAKKRNCDFSICNSSNVNIFHLTSILFYENENDTDSVTNRLCNLRALMETLPLNRGGSSIRNAPINKVSSEGYTPLLYAIFACNVEAAFLLLNEGALLSVEKAVCPFDNLNELLIDSTIHHDIRLKLALLKARMEGISEKA